MRKANCIRGCVRMSMVPQSRAVLLALDTALVGTPTHGFVPVLGSLFCWSWEELESGQRRCGQVEFGALSRWAVWRG